MPRTVLSRSALFGVVAVAIVSFLAGERAHASHLSQSGVEQTVGVFMDDETGSQIDADRTDLQVPTSTDITGPITASIAGGGYSANGIVGQFGHLGVQAQSIRPGELKPIPKPQSD